MAEGGNYELFCLGNPLLDIQGKGDDALLEQYGLKPNDAILAESQHLSLYDELTQNRDAKLIAGGAAQNSARGAAYILPQNSVVYVGCVGKDKSAEILKEAAEKSGLRVEYRYDNEQPTGRCGVIITGYDRSMVTDLAAANHNKLEHLKSPEVWKFVEQAKAFYIGGYHLTVCVPAIMALAEHAAENNKVFMLSLSAPFIPQFFKDQLDATAPYWDYVIGNETEARSYAASHALGTEDVTEIAKSMAKLPKQNTKRPRTVVITQGTEPTVAAVYKDGAEVEVHTFPVHPIDKTKIVDTNGAGDAFAGGFAAGVVMGRSLEEAMHMGQWLAKLSIQELGPQYPFPKQSYAGEY
ncbi:Ribokinase-like protein [Patellaria atrata CBS 101060]|uniref:Adenosine kinase n=1 Tax=Patellaria atrata CBS 101060 TaxID=1346257 RepID=A0A9P4SL83_9PEZI|nr:Ribokinase-like protein [Patellaria atrata CBS 101060]